jgi:hypothetical protein
MYMFPFSVYSAAQETVDAHYDSTTNVVTFSDNTDNYVQGANYFVRIVNPSPRHLIAMLTVEAGAYGISGSINVGALAEATYEIFVDDVNGTTVATGKFVVDATVGATVPGIPQNFTATPGNRQVTLNWQSPLNNGAAITYYEVSMNNGSSWINAGNVLTYVFSDLNNGTTYTFMVRAVNSEGPGPADTATARPAATGGGTGSTGGTGGTASSQPRHDWSDSINTFNKDSRDNLVITIQRDFSLFSSVRVNNVTLERNFEYTVRSGSTIVTLNASYLETLPVGRHLLEVRFADGSNVRTEFRIAEATIPPPVNQPQPWTPPPQVWTPPDGGGFIGTPGTPDYAGSDINAAETRETGTNVSRAGDTGFGRVPQTGVPGIGGTVAIMFASYMALAGLGIYALRRRK